MEPGRALDVLIAEKVFGAKVEYLDQKAGWRIDYRADQAGCNDPIVSDFGVEGYRLKRYSDDIKAVWEVVLQLKELPSDDSDFPNDTTRFILKYHPQQNEWEAGWFSKENEEIWCLDFAAYGDTAPHAICLAALKSVGYAPQS